MAAIAILMQRLSGFKFTSRLFSERNSCIKDQVCEFSNALIICTKLRESRQLFSSEANSHMSLQQHNTLQHTLTYMPKTCLKLSAATRVIFQYCRLCQFHVHSMPQQYIRTYPNRSDYVLQLLHSTQSSCQKITYVCFTNSNFYCKQILLYII